MDDKLPSEIQPQNNGNLDRKYLCDICQSSFTQNSNLRKHLRNIHRLPMLLRDSKINQDSDFKCAKCPKAFTRKTNLRRHQIKIHKMELSELGYETSFACNFCSQIFNDVSRLKQHRRKDHPNENLVVRKIQLSYFLHECAHCGETFQKKNSLRAHMKKRHFSEIFDCKLLQEIAPDWRNDINVTKYKVLNQDQGQFFSKFFINLRNKNECNKWLSEFQYKNKITLRKRSVHRSAKPNLLYHAKYGCHHNTKPRIGTNFSGKHTKCPATIQCKIFASNDETKNYTEIRMTHIHNHAFDSLAVLKYREPIAEIKNKFRAMFLSGMTPSQALQQHKKDLEQQYGNEFHNIVGDRGICPNKSWVYNFRILCLKEPKKFDPESPTTPNFVELSTHSGNVIFTSPKLEGSYSSYSAEIDDELSSDTTQNLSNSFRTYSSSHFVNFSLTEKIPHLRQDEVSQEEDTTRVDRFMCDDTTDNLSSEDYIVFCEFDQMNEIIKNMARKNPFLLSGIQEMVKNFRHNLEDPISLNNALYTFGNS